MLGALPIPVPGSEAGGPMHRLPQLSALNALRLALIPAGGDWRDLPAEVQLVCSPRSGVFGVSGWEDTSCCVVGAAGHDNGRYAVADPRVLAPRREGSMGVVGWDGITHAVIGCASLQNTALNAADPRLALAQATHWITSDGRLVGHTQLALDARRCMVIILAADGTWHRPMTTLELAALQGFDVGDALRGWLSLPGRSQARHREWIGNAVPPAAAAEIALQCLLTLNAAKTGGFRLVSSLQKPWVAPPQLAA